MNNNLEKNIEIETAIKELQANPCEELLAKVLSIFRKIMTAQLVHNGSFQNSFIQFPYCNFFIF